MSKYRSDQVAEVDDATKLVASLKALANDNRLAIFEYLRRHEVSILGAESCPSVGEIPAEFVLTLSTLSHHLKELYRSGLITCERRGKNVFCVVNQEAVRGLQQYFSG